MDKNINKLEVKALQELTGRGFDKQDIDTLSRVISKGSSHYWIGYYQACKDINN